MEWRGLKIWRFVLQVSFDKSFSSFIQFIYRFFSLQNVLYKSKTDVDTDFFRCMPPPQRQQKCTHCKNYVKQSGRQGKNNYKKTTIIKLVRINKYWLLAIRMPAVGNRNVKTRVPYGCQLPWLPEFNVSFTNKYYFTVLKTGVLIAIDVFSDFFYSVAITDATMKSQKCYSFYKDHVCFFWGNIKLTLFLWYILLMLVLFLRDVVVQKCIIVLRLCKMWLIGNQRHRLFHGQFPA